MMIDYTHKEFYNGLFASPTYKAQFERLVSDLLAFQVNGEVPSMPSRLLACDAIVDAYVEQTGYVPDGIQLQFLANWLLFEELTNPHPDKVTRTEYPVMNKRQLRTRHYREKSNEFIEDGASNVTALPSGKQKQMFRNNNNSDA